MKKHYLLSLFISFLFVLSASAQGFKELSLKDIWGSRDFFPQRPADLQSLKDGEHYILNINDSVNIYEYLSGNRTGTLFTTEDLIRRTHGDTLQMEDFTLSQDEKKVLITTQTEPIYRRSSISTYFVLDLVTKTITPVSTNGKQRLAEFSPDGSKVAFVRDNNLFIKDLMSGTEIQVTTDGVINNIINGATDWVYEEEFEFSKAFFWSPDSKKIAFYRFDESQVKEYTMVTWGKLYPEQYPYKYPKAGEANSLVTILVYELSSKKIKQMDIGKETDQYIPRVKWTPNPGKLAIYRMNRLQNKLEMLLADVNSGNTNILYTEENKCYIEITDDLTFTDDNLFFFLTSEKDGFRHIYLYGMDGKLIRQITHGNWVVTGIKGYDQKNRAIYFQSTETSPLDRDISVINLDGTRMKKNSKKKGWNNADFSATFKYLVHSVSDANTPPVYSVCTTRGKELRMLEDNAKLVERTKDYGFSKVEFFTIPSAGYNLNAYMIKPANFDSTKKYPVFMNVYGGPGAQDVSNRFGHFDFIWYQMLAQRGYISVCVDNRGTGFRGEAFEKCTYLQLGKYETEDQIEAAKYLGKLNYVDSKRIGIWGWSYGGYISSLCMTKGGTIFKAGIAVAPVTNWRYYDNIYTERFMRTPQENAKGYDENSPINSASGMQGDFLLVHGTSDDNVHFQNSMEFSNALIKANRQFREFFYPNRNHGIYGGNTRMHLYKMLTDFLMEKL
ncbi:MAG: S9 family peptidase [Bacteroidetes bacterium]|nr:S9 family peptidase [Bacteroidota bacterium]